MFTIGESFLGPWNYRTYIGQKTSCHKAQIYYPFFTSKLFRMRRLGEIKFPFEWGKIMHLFVH
jgi:hypothetical protein